jgi:hypothetical protein
MMAARTSRRRSAGLAAAVQELAAPVVILASSRRGRCSALPTPSGIRSRSARSDAPPGRNWRRSWGWGNTGVGLFATE